MGAETELAIKFLGIAGEEVDAAIDQIRMRENACDQPFTQAVATVLVGDHHIAEVADGGSVGDDAGDPDLLLSEIEAEAEGILEAAGDDIRSAICGPIGAPEQRADCLKVHSLGVVRYSVIVALPLHTASLAERHGVRQPPV